MTRKKTAWLGIARRRVLQPVFPLTSKGVVQNASDQKKTHLQRQIREAIYLKVDFEAGGWSQVKCSLLDQYKNAHFCFVFAGNKEDRRQFDL